MSGRSVGDAVVAAYDRHQPVYSWPLWGCGCGLSFTTNTTLQQHIRGMLRLAVERPPTTPR